MNKEKLITLIHSPYITEKATSVGSLNQVVFKVDLSATKQEIKKEAVKEEVVKEQPKSNGNLNPVKQVKKVFAEPASKDDIDPVETNEWIESLNLSLIHI